MNFGMLNLAVAFCVALPSVVNAAAYQNTVMSLSPTYYYQLNETTTAGGAVDSMGNAAPGTYNGTYGFGQADVGFAGPLEVNGGIAVPGVGGASNVSHFSNNVGHINLGNAVDYAANAMTVAMFVKAGSSQGGDRLFTNNSPDALMSFQITVGGTEGLIIGTNPNASRAGAAKTLKVPDNSGNDRGLNLTTDWWHIVASTSGTTSQERYDNIQVWVNGVDRTANMLASGDGWGVDTGIAKIGGRRANPTDSTTHSGAQDEVSIWLDRVLTPAEVGSLWTAATVPEPSTVTILAIAGVAGLAVVRRRK